MTVTARASFGAHWILLAAACSLLPASAESMVEFSSETRFQFDLKVPDAALASYLPAGFTPNVAAQGAAKDCNLRRSPSTASRSMAPTAAALGKGSNRLVYLVAPVKDPTGANVQLVIGGLTEDPADAGPFGNSSGREYTSKIHDIFRRRTDNRFAGLNFAAATGEHLQLHIKYERGVGNKGNPADTKFDSAKNPSFIRPRARNKNSTSAQYHHQSRLPRQGVLLQRLGRQLRQDF